MTNYLTQAINITEKIQEAKKACELIYGEGWWKIRDEYVERIKKHHQDHKTKSPLESALRIIENTNMIQQERIVYLWAINYI